MEKAFKNWESITMGDLVDIADELMGERKVALKVGDITINFSYNVKAGQLKSRSSLLEICESEDVLFMGELLRALFSHISILTDK